MKVTYSSFFLPTGGPYNNVIGVRPLPFPSLSLWVESHLVMQRVNWFFSVSFRLSLKS